MIGVAVNSVTAFGYIVCPSDSKTEFQQLLWQLMVQQNSILKIIQYMYTYCNLRVQVYTRSTVSEIYCKHICVNGKICKLRD